MHFNFHIRVDELQRALSGLHLASTCLNRMGGKGLRAGVCCAGIPEVPSGCKQACMQQIRLPVQLVPGKLRFQWKVPCDWPLPLIISMTSI